MGAMAVMLFHVEITGKRRDTKTVMRRLEGGDWKSTSDGNSLVAYPTARSVLRGRGYSNITLLPDHLPDVLRSRLKIDSQTHCIKH